MNRSKLLVGNRSDTSNLSLPSDDMASINRSKMMKSSSKDAMLNVKPLTTKNRGPGDGYLIPSRLKIQSNVMNRAQSVEKLLNKDGQSQRAKSVKEKVKLRDGTKIIRNKQGSQQENLDNGNIVRSASPNKGRVLRESNNKSRDTPLTKRTLEVVSEVNEENIKETQATTCDLDKEVMILEACEKKGNASLDLQSKRSDFILEELFFVQSKLESPKRLIANLTPIEKPRLSEPDNSMTLRDENSHSPLLCETESRSMIEKEKEKEKGPASIRGVFFKEHISTKERQKEQDQKKQLKEQLDFQLNEKKRLKEEEKMKEQEKQKREEDRIRREMNEINKQYERETVTVKSRQQDIRTTSPMHPVIEKRLTAKKEVSSSDEKPASKDRARDYETPILSPVIDSRTEFRKEHSLSVLKEEFSREERPKMKINLPGIGEIKKLTQENQELRDENLKKNELIDILISALKNKSQDNPNAPYSNFIQNIPQPQTAREKQRTSSILTGMRGAENYDQIGSGQRIESLTDRSTTSPLTSDGLDLKNDEPLVLISAPSAIYNTSSTQASSYRNTESLSRLPPVNKLPELYNHKRGYSSPLDLHNLQAFPMVLPSKSTVNSQGLDSLSNFRGTTLTMPIHRVSPRVFNLNLNSPTAVIPMPKVTNPKNEGLIITPRTYSQYGRNKGFDDKPDVDAVFGLANLNINLENYRIPASASQLTLKKNYEMPSLQLTTPFKSSTIPGGQKTMNDARSPIRVVDMGTSQLILTSRSKETYQETTKECKTERVTVDELKEFKIQPTRIEKDVVRFKSEPPRVAMVKSLVSMENTLEKEEYENGQGGIQQGSGKGRFPKDVFSMSLRKKAACV